MSDQQHIIRRQIIEVQAPTKEKALNLQQTVSDLVQSKVNELIEEVCNKISAENELIEIDHLELDLGNITPNAIHFEFPKKTKEKLEEALAKEIHKTRNAPTSSEDGTSTNSSESSEKSPIRIKPLKESKMERLMHFLQTGSLPWQAKDNTRESIEDILDELISSQPNEIKNTLLELVKNDAIIQRIIYQFTSTSIESIFKLISPKHAKIVINLSKDLIEIQLQKNISYQSSESFKQEIYREAFIQLVVNSSSVATEEFAQTYLLAAITKASNASKSENLLIDALVKVKEHITFKQEKRLTFKTEGLPEIFNETVLNTSTLKVEGKRQIFKKDYDRLAKKFSRKTPATQEDTLEQSTQQLIEEFVNFLAAPITAIKPVQHQFKQITSDVTNAIIWELKSGKLTEKKMLSVFSKLKKVIQQLNVEYITFSKKQQLNHAIVRCEKEITNQLSLAHKTDEALIEKYLKTVYQQLLNVITEKQEANAIVTSELIDKKIESIESQLTALEKENKSGSILIESKILLSQIKQLLQYGRDEARLKTAYEKLLEIESILNIRTSNNEYTINQDFFAKQEKEIVIDAYIENAGLVLLWNFLTPLFRNLGLVENKEFVSTEAQHRAVHVSQYLITGETTTSEYELILNKLLCGMEPEDPVPLGIELSEDEKAECETVLEAMIANWTILGKASIPGVREKFLIREGILYKEGKNWNVKVERGSFDMLLDQIPWSYGMIKMPWNEEFIYVQW